MPETKRDLTMAWKANLYGHLSENVNGYWPDWFKDLADDDPEVVAFMVAQDQIREELDRRAQRCQNATWSVRFFHGSPDEVAAAREAQSA